MPQPVVVDANILISLLIAKGTKHELFFSERISPISPEFVLFEIGKYWSLISEKSALPEDELKLEFSAVRMQLNMFSLADIKRWIEEAEQISPDKNDSEYFALALNMKCPIWSEDKALKRQNIVKVFSTAELLSEAK
jgi:predicted nucleic acid-binding protein